MDDLRQFMYRVYALFIEDDLFSGADHIVFLLCAKVV